MKGAKVFNPKKAVKASTQNAAPSSIVPAFYSIYIYAHKKDAQIIGNDNAIAIPHGCYSNLLYYRGEILLY